MTCKTATTYLTPGYIDSNGGMDKKFFTPESLVNRLNALLSLPYVWQSRVNQRRQLMELLMDMENRYILDDMGISTAEALLEAQKPFWMA